MQKMLESRIEQVHKILEQNKEEWQTTYDKQADIILDNRNLIDQFTRSCRNIEHLQFYLTEVSITPPSIFKIAVRYKGQPIATIETTKDNSYITTEQYNENNKKDFECKIQLKDEEWNSKKTQEFIEYFKENMPIKNKGNEQARIESVLLSEFSKTSSSTKILTGIQPIRIGNLYHALPIPIKSNKADTEYINILTRTRVRKLTIFEIMKENQTEESAFTQATDKAVFLLNLMDSTSGDKFYKIMGYHGRKPSRLNVKVCIAVDEKSSSKLKKFEPYTIQYGANSIEYHYMYFREDKNKITSIKTSVNG